MQKNIILLGFLLFSIVVFSQEKEKIRQLKGQIIQSESKEPLPNAHIINLNTVIGTTTDNKGNFELNTVANDTIYVSYLGFQSIKIKVTNDLLKGNEVIISLHETTQEIKEVVVKSHKLIGVLEIDAKNIPKDIYTRIHIDGIAQTYEVGVARAKSYDSPVAAIFQPIDFFYNQFGKKPVQLKKLRKLKEDDQLRAIMEQKFNREIMMEYLNMDYAELNELLNNCNYSEYFIKKASDLQIIEALLECYENYKAVKKGSTLKN
ncbi:MAG TPA: carboxypeptidase-like regulatory domain-containing protein [Flavobacteriaceae bacterium]|nr:carboxypeptidase-like regulatory domain-containing protein [Flavobacteriaceae bacterium]